MTAKTYTAMKHQAVSLDFLRPRPAVLDFSDPGCVSADTEYLTPTGWKRIDTYTGGDLVAQFLPDTKEIEFVAPLDYVKKPCKEMIAIEPVRGTSQRLSPEHRVLFYRPDGSWGECSAEQFRRDMYQHNPSHLPRKFACTFTVKNDTRLDLTDAQIRLQVAVIADGSFNDSGSLTCTVRLKKERKQLRLRTLLAAAGVQYAERTCGGQPDFQVFRFQAPLRDKVFGSRWWQASQQQLEVIAAELPHWDSNVSDRPSKAVRFSTYEEQSAEFAQYAFAAAKHPATLNYSIRQRRGNTEIEYTVYAQAQDALVGPGRKDSVYVVPNTEGHKYCFSVPSTFLLLRRNGRIFATGNTGKTFVEIMDFDRNGKRPMIVFAPKSILEAAWANDIKKFAPHLKVSVAYAENREKAFAVDADVYITNIDAVNWVAKQSPKFMGRFERMVVDESSMFKHATSQRSKAAAKIAPKFAIRRLLSGTPASRSITDVWHQAYLADGGQRLGKSFYAFRNSVCDPIQVGASRDAVEWVDREYAAEAVFALLDDITIRHKFEDCVDIPPNHTYAIPFTLPAKLRKVYDQMEKEAIAELSKHKVITAMNAAIVAQKLLQIASGAVYDEAGDAQLIASERYELVADLVEQRDHSVTFFQWKHQREQLEKEFKKRKLRYAVIDGTVGHKERAEAEKFFQGGFFDTILCHPQSAGHGLTFTKGTATIWTSPTHNTELWKQGLHRVFRTGQKQKTENIVVVADNTYDLRAYENCLGKLGRMTNLLSLFER